VKTVYLLSDFGTSDTYAAQMKAVILSKASGYLSVIDLTHDIEPGSITSAAFHLYVSGKVIPSGSVVIAVVDPGVGTDSRGVVCEVEGVHYIGPDNGIFGLLSVSRSWNLPDPPTGSSNTFHGRDYFAPAGARLITDPGWLDFLVSIPPDNLVRSGIETHVRQKDFLKAAVAHVDRFGNAILWLPIPDAHGFHPTELQLPSGRIEPVLETVTYADNPGVLYIQGSQGLMEIAVSRGSASELLELTSGDIVVLKE